VEVQQKQTVYIVAASALFLVLLFAPVVSAQVGISTFEIDLGISPGESSTDSLYITNEGDSPRYVRIEAVDWMPTTQEYLPPGTLERSLTPWLAFWPSEVSVDPGAAAEIHVEVTPPPTVKGVYWGVLFLRLETQPAASDEGQVQIGMNVIFAVKVYADTGDGVPEGRITDFSCEPLDTGEQMRFALEFENTGITRLRPTGTIQIRDASGDVIRKIDLSGGMSLPGTKSKFVAALTAIAPEEGPGEENIEAVKPQSPLPPGSFVAVAIIDYGGDALVAAQLPFTIGEETSE